MAPSAGAAALAEARASLAQRSIPPPGPATLPNGSAGWTEINGTMPSGRASAALAYDPLLGVVVLFGGYFAQVAAAGDTWEYANGTWTNLTVALTVAPPARWEAAFAYDAFDGYLVLFGGRNVTAFFNDTWAFTSTGWQALRPVASPSARGLVGIDYVPTLRGLLLYGGGVGNLPGGAYNPWTIDSDTWLFSAGQWRNLTTSISGSPPGLAAPGFALDPSSGAVVMLGGTDQPNACAPMSSEWTFANSTWTNQTRVGALPYGAPGFSTGGMVDDPALTGVLLFGGDTVVGPGGCGSTNQTWLYQNGSWSNVTSALVGPVPESNQWFPMAYDASSQTVLMEGGNVEGTYLYTNETWSFSGSEPLALTVSASATAGPPPLAVNFTALPTGGLAPYSINWSFGDGSNGTGGSVSHTFTASGTYLVNATVIDAHGSRAGSTVTVVVSSHPQIGEWVSEAGPVAPSSRSAAAMAYDPGLCAVVLFGGYLGPAVLAGGDTWEYSNGSWTDLTASLPIAPGARWEAGFAYDPALQSLVLFGGRNVTSFFNDTWTFNASGWSLLPSVSAPTPRGLVGMTYDPGAGAIVLFGGGMGNAPALRGPNWTLDSDTWELVNATWKNVTPTGASPPAVTSVGFAFDPSDGYDLLVGGTTAPNGCASLDEEWTFHHGTWTNRTGSFGPGNLSDFGMTYDADGRGILLFGGVERSSTGGCASVASTWAYSNGTWSNLSAQMGSLVPTDRHAFPMVFDAADGYALLFGGNTFNSLSYLSDSWGFVDNVSPLSPIPVSVAISGASGSGPLNVSFAALLGPSVQDPTFEWQFGDGTDLVGGATIFHVYAGSGTFLPALVLSVAGGGSVTIHLPSVHVYPNDATGAVPGTGTGLPALGVSDLAGVAAGILLAVGVWILLDRRRARWRREGLEWAADDNEPDPAPEPTGPR